MGLGLYVHIPFCKSKCYYCDFCSIPDLSRRGDYMEALETEARLLVNRFGRLSLETIYIGGGTPTLLESREWQKLARLIERHFDCSDLAEWSAEGNPESITLKKAQVLRALGVNRFSMGVQSSDRKLLRAIGRIHSPEEAERAFEALRQAGFDNINLDLMTGLPGQTLTTVEETLLWVARLDPEHVSAYGLKLEEGTPFDQLERKGLLKLPEETLERQMDHRIREALKARGYQHYEISNYAKPTRACRHNLNYWNCGSYAALGLSAHGYLNGARYANTTDLDRYVQDLKSGVLPMVSEEPISLQEDEKEWIMLRLRLSEGIAFADYQARYGKVFAQEKKDAILKMQSAGWIEVGEDRLKLTENGFDFANAVIVALM